MFKRSLSIFLCAIIQFYGIPRLHAEEVVPSLPVITTPSGERDPGAVISPLRKGDRSPFTGIALSPLAVATIKVQLDSIDDTVEIEVKRAKDEAKAIFDRDLETQRILFEADKSILLARVESNVKLAESLDKQLQLEINDRPNVILWTCLGVVAGAGLTLLAVYATSQSLK